MRLFLAAAFPGKDLLLLQKAQQIIAQNSSRASLVKKDNLHLTLHFLGETGKQDADRLLLSLNKLDPGLITDLYYRFCGYGFFARDDGRLIFSELELNENFYKLQQELASLLQDLGFRLAKRKWQPHVTLARRTDLKLPWQEIINDLPRQQSWQEPEAVLLFQSEFTDRGMKYSPLLSL